MKKKEDTFTSISEREQFRKEQEYKFYLDSIVQLAKDSKLNISHLIPDIQSLLRSDRIIWDTLNSLVIIMVVSTTIITPVFLAELAIFHKLSHESENLSNILLALFSCFVVGYLLLSKRNTKKFKDNSSLVIAELNNLGFGIDRNQFPRRERHANEYIVDVFRKIIDGYNTPENTDSLNNFSDTDSNDDENDDENNSGTSRKRH